MMTQGITGHRRIASARRRPALMASLSEVPSEVRGSVLGLNITVSSLGWLGATALGGWLIDHHGFASLGALGALVALGGSAFAVLAWRTPRLEAPPTPAAA